MRTLQSLELIKEQLSPSATASYGAELLNFQGAGLAAVAGSVAMVVDGSRLDLADDSLLVGELARPVPALEAELSLKEAARRMADAGADAAWVIKDGALMGVATLSAVLDDLGMSRDPLTGLPWSDKLREWGLDRLSRGQEVILLFIDLNSFGQYNKKYGHIYGDKVIQELVAKISPFVRTSTDIFVRYAGDEFVIASTRSRQEAERMATDLRALTLQVDGIEEAITFSLGVSGGKRTKERTAVHFAATLDNLINMASKDALRRKPKKGEEAPAMSFDEVLSRFKKESPERANLLADVQYAVVPSSGPTIRLLDYSGQELANAPLGQDLGASLSAAIARWSAV